ENGPEINRVGVGCQEQRLRVHQLRENEDRVVGYTGVVESLPKRRCRGALKGVHKRLRGVHEVEIVIDLLDRFLARSAILEIKRSKARLKSVRGRDGRGRLRERRPRKAR